MNELNAAIKTRLEGTALTSLLAGTSASYPSPLYHLQAAEDAPMPYVVWNIQGGGPVNLDSNRVDNLVVFVRGYCEQSAALAGSIDAQIDTLLHLVPLTVSGWTNTWLAREQNVETVETLPNGSLVFMSGALYRARIDKN